MERWIFHYFTAQPGKWTLGKLVNNVFSFAAQSSRPDVNQMLLQYFVNYNLKKGRYITWQAILTANWESPVIDDGWCHTGAVSEGS